MILSNAGGERVLEFCLANEGHHTLHFDVEKDVAQPVTVLFRSAGSNAQPFCVVQRVSLMPAPFDRVQLYPWSTELIATSRLRLVRYDE